MNTEANTLPIHSFETDASGSSSTIKKAVLGAATLLLVTAGIAGIQRANSDEMSPPTRSAQEQVTRDLVERGLIPAQTLEVAKPSRDEITRQLVERGLIPAQTLEVAKPSRDEITRQLVERGLIPAQTLETVTTTE